FDGDFLIRGLTNQQVLEKISARTDVIGVSCMFVTDWAHNKTLIHEIAEKFPDKLIVIGGEQASSTYDHILSQTPAHIVVIGEGESAITEIARNFSDREELRKIKGIALKNSSGEMLKTEKRLRMADIDSIAEPDWDYFPIHNYFNKKTGCSSWDKKKIPMLMSRGCPYQCAFCTSPQMWGTSYKSRDVEAVIREIKKLKNKYGIEHIEFYDLTAILNKKWAMQFTSRLIEENLGITWSMPAGTRSEILDYEMLNNMKLSGCDMFAYAPESGSERILKKVRKRINKDKILSSMKICSRVGIKTRANMIVGFPGETHSDILQTFWFSIRMVFAGMDDLNLAQYCPQPGSEMYKEFYAELSEHDKKNIEKIWQNGFATNFKTGKSGTKELSPLFLKFYLFMLPAVFYFFYFLVKPTRIFHLIKNVVVRNPQRNIESFVLYKLQNLLPDPKGPIA
ncbi:MAG: B12-binding domain-containing radical SAM protein, partial [Pseudobdellovibrio sp.]